MSLLITLGYPLDMETCGKWGHSEGSCLANVGRASSRIRGSTKDPVNKVLNHV